MEKIYSTFNFISKIFASDIDLFITTDFTSEIIQLIPSIISILTITGFALYIKKLVKIENFWLSFFLCLIIVVFIQYASFALGIFWEIKFFIQIIGVSLFIVFSTIFALNFRLEKLNATINLNLAFINLILIFIPFYVFIVTQDLGMNGFDTFIFHGLFSKHINEFGDYWTSESIINIDNLSNMPFFYLLQNFFMHQGIFNERLAVFANNLFSFSGLLALLNATDKNFFKRLALLIIFLILFSMFGHGALFSLITEHCMAITFAVYLFFLSSRKNTVLSYILLFTLPILVLMKENFIFLIPFLIIIGLIDKNFKANSSYKIPFFEIRNNLTKAIFIFVSILFLSLFLYFIHHLNIDYPDSTRSPLDLIFEAEKFNLLYPTALNILNSIFLRNIIIPGDLTNYFKFFDYSAISPFSSPFILLLVMYIYLHSINKEKFNLSLKQFILVASFLSYFIFLNFTYLFAMNTYTSSQLLSFERYMAVYFFGFLLFYVSSSNFMLNSILTIRFGEMFLVSIILLLFFINGLINSYMYITHNPDVQFVKNEKKIVKELALSLYKYDPDRNYNNIGVVFDTNRAHSLKWSVLRFYLAPHRDLKEIKLNIPRYFQRNNKILEDLDLLITENLSNENEIELYKLTKEKSFINSKLNICTIDNKFNKKVDLWHFILRCSQKVD